MHLPHLFTLTNRDMIKRVIKRDGRIVEFNNQKIVAAILKAMAVTSQGEDIILPLVIMM